MEKFYITTTLPYVNAKPHIGFALEIIQADVIARWQKQLGKEVFFNTGTDEHGLKIYRNAQEQGKDTQAYVDENAAQFDNLKKVLNLSYNAFIRTTDPHHKKAAQEFWKRCEKNGDIYKKEYKIKYCVGCELEKTESELKNGKCPIHQNLELETIEEENYFFRFKKYEDDLLNLYKNNPDFVLPKSRLKEIANFVKGGLEDFSISRLKKKMPWGVPVPGDDDHIMYVWFDALINYISTLGWPEDKEKFEEFWGTKEKPNGLQTAGKDNLRQQSAMWQAMLMSAGLPPSKQILIHGFITSGGQKMSKSLGNVVDPFIMVEKYSTDALRYFLLSEIPPFEDGDFTEERFKEVYNANLANGLGNLTSRIMKMAEQFEDLKLDDSVFGKEEKKYKDYIKNFEFNKAMDIIWQLIGQLDSYVQEKQPFKLIKENKEKAKEDLEYLVSGLSKVAGLLSSFLPETSEKILEAIKNNKMPLKPIFPRFE